MAGRKKIMFGEPETWNNPDGSRMTVDQFLEAQNDYNNDPKFLDALVNTPYLDMPLNALNPKAIEDRQIKIDAKRELDKDLMQIRDNPVAYVENKIDLYSTEDQENLNYLKNLANKKQKVDSDENLKKNINTARAMGILPEPRKALDYKRGPKNLSDYELKFIGKHPSQKKPIVVEEVKKPKIEVPQEPVEVTIKKRADARYQKELEEYEKRYGRGGLAVFFRPL